MEENHPITPPPELVQQWRNEWHHAHGGFDAFLATQAARWGADQELEACCEWIDTPAEFETVAWNGKESDALRAARRPKPQSLKTQALEQLDRGCFPEQACIDTIRRALEALPE